MSHAHMSQFVYDTPRFCHIFLLLLDCHGHPFVVIVAGSLGGEGLKALEVFSFSQGFSVCSLFIICRADDQSLDLIKDINK